jgi:hypothetical protein
MVKRMLFAVAILALAVLGPSAGLLEAARPSLSDLCYPGTSCTSNYHCGVVSGLPQGICHNGICYCY